MTQSARGPGIERAAYHSARRGRGRAAIIRDLWRAWSMSGFLFLADVIAFVLVMTWACSAEAPGRKGERGLLGMKIGKDDAGGKRGRKPRWAQVPEAGAAPGRGSILRPTPGWRRTLVARRAPGR
jgi:hypothetical protein